MIKKIKCNKYRKLEDLTLDFSPTINIISGTNGTCKSSILHIVSNSFQAVTKSCSFLNDVSCLETIKKLNSLTNPKIEKLTRDSKDYNDPAKGLKGALYSVEYFNAEPLEFRRHNSRSSQSSKYDCRFAVKPNYSKGNNESLPYCPVIYLGLGRLVPFGEFYQDHLIKDVNTKLDQKYKEEIQKKYYEFTGINLNIPSFVCQNMGDIKKRSDFTSDTPGIEANTISAGEDNLFIILTALISLKYYYESIVTENTVESILLIDEVDATLHPSFQYKLLKLFDEYSIKYKIQIIFTTHSISLLEYAFKKKHNVIYLRDAILTVKSMESPDIYKIKLHLQNECKYDIYLDKKIPLFTEDDEARIFLKIIFEYLAEKYPSFSKVKNLFHFVDANIGASNLKSIFNDDLLLRSTMRSICVLDGDQQADLNNYTIKLPGSVSPEKLIMDYSLDIFNKIDDSFWENETIVDLNYGIVYYRDNIMPGILSIDEELKRLKDNGKSTHGVTRELYKTEFSKYKRFYELLFKHWVRADNNQRSISHFNSDLYSMFKKVSDFHGINPKEWSLEDSI